MDVVSRQETMSRIAIAGAIVTSGSILAYLVMSNSLASYDNWKTFFGGSRSEASKKTRKHRSSYDRLVGNTPMIKLEKLSQLIGRNIFVKVISLFNCHMTAHRPEMI